MRECRVFECDIEGEVRRSMELLLICPLRAISTFQCAIFTISPFDE